MDFTSPRFQGFDRLLDILNDPDTGTKKLQVGDVGDDVRAVQQALWELAWTWRIHPTFPDPAQFIIGQFGPVTERVVLAYKTNYDIRYPFGDPTGILDPYVGPHTLAHLDADIVEYDLGTAAISAHHQELVDAGWQMVLDDHEPPMPRTWVDSGGQYYLVKAWDENGMYVWAPQSGAWEVHDPILSAWQDRDGRFGELAFPTSDVRGDEHGNVLCDFEGGTLYCDVNTGTSIILGQDD